MELQWYLWRMLSCPCSWKKKHCAKKSLFVLAVWMSEYTSFLVHVGKSIHTVSNICCWNICRHQRAGLLRSSRMCGQAWPSSSWRHTPPTWLPTWRDSRLSSAWKVFLTPRWDYSWDLNKYWNTTDAEDEAQNQPRGGNTCTLPLVCIVCKDSCL